MAGGRWQQAAYKNSGKLQQLAGGMCTIACGMCTIAVIGVIGSISCHSATHPGSLAGGCFAHTGSGSGAACHCHQQPRIVWHEVPRCHYWRRWQWQRARIPRQLPSSCCGTGTGTGSCSGSCIVTGSGTGSCIVTGSGSGSCIVTGSGTGSCIVTGTRQLRNRRIGSGV
jgi:hypothetical protein